MNALEQGYRRCAELTRRHGTTYYWGALLLSADQRRDVFAVYALCRLADDIVDEPETVQPSDTAVPRTGTPAERLAAFRAAFFDALARGTADEPVMAAIVDSIGRRGTDPECFDRFFDAMAMDLEVASYETFDDLCGYMEGSAAVIGEMMLPVLNPSSPDARGPARALGHAFQLTNFLRDVNEDLDRGRVYLPQADLARHGADPSLRRVTPEWRAMMAEQVARNRALYAEGQAGLPLLPPASRRCVGTALVLYSRILDRIEAADYDVFSGRLRVPAPEKAAMTLRAVALGVPHVDFTPRPVHPVRPERLPA